MHLPAASQWILIDADEVQNVTGQQQYAPACSLCKVCGGINEFDKDRWWFWQHRFVTLADLGILNNDTRSAARQAEDKMATLTGLWENFVYETYSGACKKRHLNIGNRRHLKEGLGHFSFRDS